MNIMKFYDPSFDSIESLFNSFFYDFPSKEVKPPLAQKVNFDDNNATDVTLQLALAGFKEEDVKVWHENNVLYVEGSNMKNEDVLEKFRTQFKKKFPVSDKMDLSKSEVKFSNGLLTIKIPVLKPVVKKKFLFGRAAE